MDLKAMVRRVFKDVLEGGKIDLAGELLTDDFKNYDMPAPVPGRAGFVEIVKAWREAFPDLAMDIHDVVADGDTVVTRGVFRGTHRGPFNGIPATGKKVEAAWIDMWKARNGKFAENWVRIDMVAMLTQLGVMPPPPK